MAKGALALKIYNSQGEEEYTDQECDMIASFSQNFAPVVYDSVRDYIENQKKHQEQ